MNRPGKALWVYWYLFLIVLITAIVYPAISKAALPVVEVKKLLAYDAQAYDHFGFSIAISGDYAIMGADWGDAGVDYAGAAYIFHRVGPNTWDAGIKITASDAEAYDYFGYSVAISGDYAIVGAHYEDTGGWNAGAAYIFHCIGHNTWDDGTKITAFDAEADDHFGRSVAISGDYAIVGAYGEDTGGSAAGAAYIFLRTGTNTWDAGTKITASDAEAGDNFGGSVAISGDYAIVGARYEDTGGSDAGAAYIFLRTGPNTWDSGTKITASDAEAGDYFGSVAIGGDYAIVGACGEDTGGSKAGAAYIFFRTGPDTWDAGTKITASDAEAGDYFGGSVAISGDYAIAGASWEDTGGSNAGAAYIFLRTGTNTWDTGTKITASDAGADDFFGGSVAIGGDYVIMSASGEDAGSMDAGAAYISAIGFLTSPISDNTTEAGGQAAFTVRLTNVPTADVTIAVTSSKTGEGTVDTSSLTFTDLNWNVDQTVTVTGVDNPVADGDQGYTIVLGPVISADPNYNGLNPSDVTVTNTDDETAGFTVSAISGNTTEVGGQATFTVRLNSEPLADVTITVTSSDTGEGTLDKSSLTFTSLNWNVNQTVTVTGVDEFLADGDQIYTILLGAAGSADADYNGLNPWDVTVINTDDETMDFTVSAISGITTEAGGRATFTVRLSNAPTSDVTIPVTSSDTDEGTVDTSSLTFTYLDWFIEQTVTVTGVDDLVADGDQSYSIVLGAVISADPNYNGLNPLDVTVTNADDETSGVNEAVHSWSKTVGGTDTDEPFSIAVDSIGNVYFTGYFSGTADFDPDPNTTDYHSSAGSADIFLTKINSDGTYEWTKTMGGPDFDMAFSVNVDSNCNVYLAGKFMDTADFDPGAGTDYHSLAGSSDIFLTKINSDGTYGWTKTMGGPGIDQGTSVVVDGSGAVYVAGHFQDTVDFNPDPYITDSYTSGAFFNMFLTRFNPDGTYAWTKAIGGPARFDQVSIVANSSGNIYLTGLFSGTADFDPDPNITDSHASVGDADIFLTKINPDGTYGWTKTMGGPGIDYASSGTVDSIGNIYLTGCFYDTTDFDPDPNTVDSHTSAGLSDIFLTRINFDGTYGWTKTMGGAHRNMSNSVTVDSSGNIYFAGFFYEHTDFDPDPNTTDHHSSAGSADIFLTKINSDGTYGWTKTMGGTGDDQACYAIADNSGNIYLTGVFTGTVDLDPGAGTDRHTSAGASDIFLTKFIIVSTPEDSGGVNDAGCFISISAFQ